MKSEIEKEGVGCSSVSSTAGDASRGREVRRIKRGSEELSQEEARQMVSSQREDRVLRMSGCVTNGTDLVISAQGQKRVNPRFWRVE